MGGIPDRPREQPRPGPHVENYQVTVRNAFLRKICGAYATQRSYLRHQPRQSQRHHEGIRSSQPPTPAAEIHAQIPDCGRKLLRRLENGGARQCHLLMLAKGAPGPDDIPPTFLKALGPRAIEELLDIVKLSFSTGKSPQISKITIILSLKKAGKPPGYISSYRPVRLTSCVVKTLERIP